MEATNTKIIPTIIACNVASFPNDINATPTNAIIEPNYAILENFSLKK